MLAGADSYDGAFLSTDNGASWNQAGLTNTNINVFAVSGWNIFAGTSNAGVNLSNNGGTNSS